MINSRKMTITLSEIKQEGILTFLREVKTTKILKTRNLAKTIAKFEAVPPGDQYGDYIMVLTQSKK